MTTAIDELLPPPTSVNDDHKDYSFGAACIFMGILGTNSVIIRLCVRCRYATLGNDDYAIIPATILFLAWTTMASYLCLNAGVGKPLWEITIPEFDMWLKGQIASIWLYPAMSGAIRISVLLFYSRIFARGDKTSRRIIQALTVLQGLYVIAFSITPGFLCQSFSRNLSILNWSSVCSLPYFSYIQTALYTISLAFDIILFLFPIYPLSKIQMGRAQKFKSSTIFMFGCCASVVAAYKLTVSIQEWVHIMPPDSPFWNYQVSFFIPGQYATYGTTFWIPSTLEPTIAMIGTSLPAMRQFYVIREERLLRKQASDTKS